MGNVRASVWFPEDFDIAVVCCQKDPVALGDGMFDGLFHVFIHSRCSLAFGIVIGGVSYDITVCIIGDYEIIAGVYCLAETLGNLRQAELGDLIERDSLG